MKTLLKTLFVVSLFGISAVANAQTMFKVSTNTYGSDTNTDIVVNYPNPTNSGSSVNIPGFGALSNGYVSSSGSAFYEYVKSAYELPLSAPLITSALTQVRIVILGTGEKPTGTNCFNFATTVGASSNTAYLVFVSNQLNKKKLLGDYCNTSITTSAGIPFGYFFIGEPNEDITPVEIRGNTNDLLFSSSFSPTTNMYLIFDGFFLNNFGSIKTSGVGNAGTTFGIYLFNGDYHNVINGFNTQSYAVSPYESYYSVVNIPATTVSHTRDTTSYPMSLTVTQNHTSSANILRGITKSTNSVLLNNNNGTFYIDNATIDKTIIKQFNGNAFITPIVGSSLRIWNSVITNSFVYNHDSLYLLNNNIGSTAIFNNGTVGGTDGGSSCAGCKSAGGVMYSSYFYASTSWNGYTNYGTLNYALLPNNNYVNKLVKSAIYNNSDVSMLLNQTNLLSTESLIFNNSGSLNSGIPSYASLNTKFTTPDNAGSNFLMDGSRYFYTYVSNSIPSSLLTSFPYCGATSSVKGTVQNCSITQLWFKSVGKSF